MSAHGEELGEGRLVATQREDRHGVACEDAKLVRAELVEVIAVDRHVASCWSVGAVYSALPERHRDVVVGRVKRAGETRFGPRVGELPAAWPVRRREQGPETLCIPAA